MDNTELQTAAQSPGPARGQKAHSLPLLLALFLFLLLLAVCVVNMAAVSRFERRIGQLEAESAAAQRALADARAELEAIKSASPEAAGGEEVPARAAESYDYIVKGIAHRGLSSDAPENTLPAFRLARQSGFSYVETDVQFTADGYAVCLHDRTIDRTSNGSGAVDEMTFAQLRQYDFGAWKSADYAGTTIPSFEEFLLLCRAVGLRPYVELKSETVRTAEQVSQLVRAVKACGMDGEVTWISFSYPLLGEVRNCAPEARLGLLVTSISYNEINQALWLKNGTNEVFLDSEIYTDAECRLCMDNGVPLEIWTVDSEETVLAMNPYISGVTSNRLIAGKVLADAYTG